MSDLSKTFSSVGIVSDITSAIYLQNLSKKKAVVTFLRVTRKKEAAGIKLNMVITINKVPARYIPLDMAIGSAYMIDIIDEHPIVLRKGDSISMSCNYKDCVDFTLSGELHEDLQ